MKQETFGEFTLESALGGLMGDSSVQSSGDSFPVMAPPTDDDDDFTIPDEIDTTKETNGFKDERSQKSDATPTMGFKNVEDIENEDEEEDVSEEDTLKDSVDDNTDADLDTIDDPEEDIKDEGDTSEGDGSVSDLGDAESEIAAFVQEKLYNKLGWDIEEGDGLDSVEALVEHMEKIVEANSTPKYASQDIKELNEFVENGGQLKDYFDVQGSLDLNNLDLTVESNQKAVVKEALKERGLSDSQAERKIQRYEDTGILEDEAVDSKEILEKIQSKKADTLLKEQKVLKEQADVQQQKFYDDVSLYIDKLDSLKGINMSKADRESVKKALFSVGPDGKTAYQKMYNEDPIKNLVESVFFTVKKDAVVKGLQRQAESKATKNLKKRLETRTKRGKNTGTFSDESADTKVDHSSLNIFNSFIKP